MSRGSSSTEPGLAEAQAHDAPVAAHHGHPGLEVLGVHVGEGLHVAQAEVDRRHQAAAASRWASTVASSLAGFTAPTTRATGSPARNRMSVGIESTS